LTRYIGRSTLLSLLQAADPAGERLDIAAKIQQDLLDKYYWESPLGTVYFPQFPPLQLGPVTIDFSITKHVFFMMVAAVLVAILLVSAGRHAARERAAGAQRGPKGAANVVEAIVLFIRDEVALRNIGHGGQRYVGYIVTVFFFILFCNLLGLLPWGASPTANISVTAALALMTFIMIEGAGMRSLGTKGYLRTIFFAPEGLHWAMRPFMYAIMTPVELIGKLTKPFALAVRLFANMAAGKAVIGALTGLIVLAVTSDLLPVQILAWTGPLLMAVAIMLLKIFVAFLQAYIFTMLSSVFIGLIRHAH
jgi:F-type H+-transporting ATPase subunit a